MAWDVSDLVELYPFLFEGLTDEHVEDLLAYLRVYPGGDPHVVLAELIADTAPALPAEAAVFDDVVAVYQQAIEACRSGGSVDEIREEADWIASCFRDAARHGTTRGEQRASLMFRHPTIVPALPGFRRHDDGSVSFDVRRMRLSGPMHFVKAHRAVREFTTIFGEFKVLPGGSRTKQGARAREILSIVHEKFPELRTRLRTPVDVAHLSPRKAALLIWAHRLELAVDIRRAEALLGEARRVVQLWERAAAAACSGDGSEGLPSP